MHGLPVWHSPHSRAMFCDTILHHKCKELVPYILKCSITSVLESFTTTLFSLLSILQPVLFICLALKYLNYRWNFILPISFVVMIGITCQHVSYFSTSFSHNACTKKVRIFIFRFCQVIYFGNTEDF